MGKRIKKLRKYFDLTQKEFAERIGSTQNNIANYETGRRTPSAAAVNNICKTFGVAEEWLRTGEGEMIIPVTPDENIDYFIRTLPTEKNTFKKQFILRIASMNESEWNALERLFGGMAKG